MKIKNSPAPVASGGVWGSTPAWRNSDQALIGKGQSNYITSKYRITLPLQLAAGSGAAPQHEGTQTKHWLAKELQKKKKNPTLT